MESKLEKRYPDLAFLLSFFPSKPSKFPEKEELLKAFGNPQLEDLEVFYLVGLSGALIFDQLEDWLDQKRERALVIVENDLGVFPTFLELSSAQKIIDHPQIHLIYSEEDPKDLLATTFPTEHLDIFIAPGKTFDSQAFLRKAGMISNLYNDVLYSYRLFENLLPNIYKIEGSFNAGAFKAGFQDIPIIICGAGPSLEKSFPLLKKYQDRALIIAGGSAISILSQNGIRPHMAIALDPNHGEFERLKQSLFFQGPFLFAPRLHRHVLATCSGPFGYLKSDTGGPIENWFEEKLGIDQRPIGPDLGEEALSVTTLALSFANLLGSDPIILAGVDLAYTDNERYAPGIALEKCEKSGSAPLDKNIVVDGKSTLVKWLMERDCIDNFAKEHPEKTLLNVSGGLGFNKIKNVSLKDVLENHKPLDLEGRLHALIETHPMKIEKKKINDLCAFLEKSLDRCKDLLEALKEHKGSFEDGRMLIYQMDLQDEEAYICFLQTIDAALENVLVRHFPHSDPKIAKQKRTAAKYAQLSQQVKCFKEVLHLSIGRELIAKCTNANP